MILWNVFCQVKSGGHTLHGWLTRKNAIWKDDNGNEMLFEDIALLSCYVCSYLYWNWTKIFLNCFAVGSPLKFLCNQNEELICSVLFPYLMEKNAWKIPLFSTHFILNHHHHHHYLLYLHNFGLKLVAYSS